MAFRKSSNELECFNCVCVNVNGSITRIKSHDTIQFKEMVPSSNCACSKSSYVTSGVIQVN